MQKSIGYSIVVSLFLSSEPIALAQDRPEGPYYRFTKVLPEALQMKDGDKANAVVGYFADANGNIDGVSLGLETASTEDIKCKFVSPPPRLVCTNTGVEGDVVSLSVNSIPDASGFDVEVLIQQDNTNKLEAFIAPGLSVMDDGTIKSRRPAQ